MNHQIVSRILKQLDSGVQVSPVAFVSPIFSVMVAMCASRSQLSLKERLHFVGDCESYAQNNGLLDCLAGKYQFPLPSGRQGVTYTKLTRLQNHVEVDACNAVVNSLIHQHVDTVSPEAANHLCQIVGELHDNVASHARGWGFSCAQVYPERNQGAVRLNFAIADGGCGMLQNVQRIRPDIQTDGDAIQWCLGQGNTTARQKDEWAQRLPDDYMIAPFPDSVTRYSQENHHMGLGLWQLAELVRIFRGELWIASGRGRCNDGGNGVGIQQFSQVDAPWNGVAIECEITVRSGQRVTHEQAADLEALAERIGL